MKRERESKYSGNHDDFRYFESITLDAFHFLVDAYEFEHVSTKSLASQCVIEYRSASTYVSVEWEWQYYVIVQLGRFAVAPDGVQFVERHDLEHLLTTRCPENHVNQKKHPDAVELKKVVDTYAALLRDWAKDVLTGDFSIFPQLRALSEDSIRRKRAMSGYPDFDAKT